MHIKVITLILLTLLCFVYFVNASTTIKLFNPDNETLEDTFSAPGYGVNRGGDSFTLIGCHSAIGQLTGFYKYTIAPIPSGQTIDNAILALWQLQAEGTPDTTYLYGSTEDDWTESTCTDSDVNCPKATTGILDSFQPPGPSNWVFINATSYISTEYSANKENVTFILNSSVSCAVNNYAWFSTKEDSAALRPYLNITFTEAAPPEDTCSCPDSGDWNIDASDNCVIDTDCDMQTNSVTCSGTGTIDVNAIISNFDNVFIHTGCDLYCRKTPSCFE